MFRTFDELIRLAPTHGYKITKLSDSQYKLTDLRGEPLLSVPTTQAKIESFLGTLFSLKERSGISYDRH